MRRYVLRLSQASIDVAVLAAAFALAFFIRFDWRPPADMLGRLALTVPYVVLGEYLVLSFFGVPSFSWRYVGLREVGRILLATLVASVALLWVRIGLAVGMGDYAFLRHGVVPVGVLVVNFVLAFMGVVGVRVLRRMLGERADTLRRASEGPQKTKVRTMLVGAGAGGLLMTKEISGRPDLGLDPVGFLDDDPDKVGSVVNGVKVLGPTERLAELCKEHEAEQVLITMASAPGDVIRRIAQLAEDADLPAQIIPGLFEIAGGRVNLSRIRPVAIEDLLRREPVELDTEAISGELAGKVVLVTGAGGSIGSELCRQVAGFAPARLLLAERSENCLFEIHRELLRAHPKLEIVPLIADITDASRMEAIFERFRPSAVFHAAAHKHVPMMEWNPAEAIKNNVFGTRLVAELSDAHGVERFVMISTDKAVNPTSVMGASKRVAEMVVQALAAKSKTRFVTVRFGNVLGSNGSVIPIFREQIARGGPITVTHPDMQRYFMTIPEACQLVLEAGSMGQGGEIFILDMGEPVKIVDLARDLIRLSGFRPDEDIKITFSGTRPGEKLFEELSVDAENADKTKHPKVFVGRGARSAWSELEGRLAALARAAEGAERERIVAALKGCVPEYVEPAEGSAPPPRKERRQTPFTLAPAE